MFVKDKIRPLIEAFINLATSIIAVQFCGLAGVFAGTIVSRICTTMWREPYLVYKHVFGQSTKHYWATLVKFFSLTVIASGLLKIGFANIPMPINIWTWILECIVATVLFNGLLIGLFKKDENFEFFKNKIGSLLNKFLKTS